MGGKTGDERTPGTTTRGIGFRTLSGQRLAHTNEGIIGIYGRLGRGDKTENWIWTVLSRTSGGSTRSEGALSAGWVCPAADTPHFSEILHNRLIPNFLPETQPLMRVWYRQIILDNPIFCIIIELTLQYKAPASNSRGISTPGLLGGENSMRCPYCGAIEDKVVDSRSSKEGTAIRRRRECLGCGRRFTTYEYIEDIPLTVIKSDGRREPFDKNKLIGKIRLSCTKRPISTAQIEDIADQIEDRLVSLGEREVEAKKHIGELVMEALKKLDDVAYVRFASVYRQFKDLSDFEKELRQLESSG